MDQSHASIMASWPITAFLATILIIWTNQRGVLWPVSFNQVSPEVFADLGEGWEAFAQGTEVLGAGAAQLWTHTTSSSKLSNIAYMSAPLLNCQFRQSLANFLSGSEVVDNSTFFIHQCNLIRKNKWQKMLRSTYFQNLKGNNGSFFYKRGSQISPWHCFKLSNHGKYLSKTFVSLKSMEKIV